MPDQPLSTRRLLELMRELQRLATQRHESEQQIAAQYEQGLTAAGKAHGEAVARAEATYEQQKQQVDDTTGADRRQLEANYEAARTGAQQEYHGLRTAAESDRKKTSAEAQARHKDEALLILSTFDAQKGQPKRKLEEFIGQLKNRRQEIAALEHDAAVIFKMRSLGTPTAAPSVEATAGDGGTSAANGEDSDAAVAKFTGELDAAVAATRSEAEALYRQKQGKLLEGAMPFGLAACLAVAAALATGFATGWSPIATAGGAVGGALLGAVGLWFGVRPVASRQAKQSLAQMHQQIAVANRAMESAVAAAQERSRREARELIDKRNQDIAALGFEIEQLLGDVHTRTGEQLKSASAEFPARLSEMRGQHEQALAEIDQKIRQQLSQVTSERDNQLAAADEAQRAERERLTAERDRQWQSMRDAWLAGYEAIAAQLGSIRKRCERLYPSWAPVASGGTDYTAWDKPAEVAMGVEFGRSTLNLASVKSGLSSDERLHPEPARFELPAMVTLTEQPTMVITADGPGRREATELMQAVMLRWITGQPPGKVRFTVLDPVGLGEGFNSFMHLADYDENLIATRIWSESRDIEEQLARLTHHMETVLQKYLRSEYESIHEYNAQAGEVAEPFQVLVVNGFPLNFSDDTARRLVSLATNGPRCGVYVMMSIDTKLRMPTDFPMDDLLATAVHLDWQSSDGKTGQFAWQYPAFGRLPLTLAEAPAPDRMVELVKQIGQAAKDAVRVEVPFDVVAPDEQGFWRGDSSDELLTPVGRAGANRLQYVRLGKGTSQHLLVAGKTGSGKSTFLHALVTSGAMHYSPDELEFYLVDFKKGVEFKSYATNRLPHARVVAIESEREFGLSVLERLDQELSRRGELYREAGVQSLADYRDKNPGERMPRVLLIIDEFQELFVEDDKLAQDATLLMDRLVRQGRAFGMHVVLGTQTLAGAFSIARSTLGQIAVRVALQCSEADSHIILSDERNTAARFLSRPGEAIYNDQNGLLSANELFQVVWLPDRLRTERLAEVDQKRIEAGLEYEPAVVFEGNTSADPAENEELRMRIAEFGLRGEANDDVGQPPARDSAIRIPQSAFLGDAVAIAPPTAVEFGRHGGSNLLIVGPDDRSALGMLSIAAVSLAVGDPEARIVVLDATREGDSSAGVWTQVADVLDQQATLTNPAGAPAAIADLAAEVARREAESDETAPPIYLVIHNAGRFRDLRRTEDDFSFSMDKEKPASPDKQLAEILKSGPGVGVHVLVWCDSYNATSRLFDRVALREFALRVVLQMSAADSSNLIDTPAASNLKPHRALFYSDETGETKKLRPYGPPSGEWLGSLKTVERAAAE